MTLTDDPPYPQRFIKQKSIINIRNRKGGGVWQMVWQNFKVLTWNVEILNFKEMLSETNHNYWTNMKIRATVITSPCQNYNYCSIIIMIINQSLSLDYKLWKKCLVLMKKSNLSNRFFRAIIDLNEKNSTSTGWISTSASDKKSISIVILFIWSNKKLTVLYILQLHQSG